MMCRLNGNPINDMIIYLIRHGQTGWNQEGRFQGNRDTELDTTGVRQAEQMGKRLSKTQHPIATIYCSPLTRAVQTAQIINRYTKAKLIPLPDLRELSYGTWEGKKREEVEKENAVFIRQWMEDRFNIPAPGGESFRDLEERLQPVMTTLTSSGAAQVAVLTHQGVLKTLLCLFLGISPAQQSAFWFQNCSLSAVQYNPAASHCKILFLNDYCHLQE